MQGKKETNYESIFFVVPTYILNLPGLTLPYLKVYEAIFQFWNKGKSCFLSNQAFMDRCDIGKTHLQDAFLFFEKNGELIRSCKGGRRHFLQPIRSVEVEKDSANNKPTTATAVPCFDIEQGTATAVGGYRCSGRGGTATAVHNIKKLNKETNVKEKIYKKEKISEPSLCTPKDIECTPPHTTENKDMAIDVNYQYPETLYDKPEEPQTTSLTVNDGLTGYNLTIEQLDSFERFWRLYPRKVGREKVKRQWFHDKCDLIADKIINKLTQQIAKDKAFLDGYVPNPSKYIMEKRYEDEVFEGKKVKGRFDHDDSSWANKNRQSIFD